MDKLCIVVMPNAREVMVFTHAILITVVELIPTAVLRNVMQALLLVEVVNALHKEALALQLRIAQQVK